MGQRSYALGKVGEIPEYELGRQMRREDLTDAKPSSFCSCFLIMLRSHLLYGWDMAALRPRYQETLAADAENLRWPQGHPWGIPIFKGRTCSYNDCFYF